MRHRIYIAGPYSSDPEGGTRRMLEVWHELRDAGFVPFAPLLSHYLEKVKSRAWDDWMQWDLEWLPLCDALLRLPGESKGADIEVAVAAAQRIPVFHSIAELKECFA